MQTQRLDHSKLLSQMYSRLGSTSSNRTPIQPSRQSNPILFEVCHEMAAKSSISKGEMNKKANSQRHYIKLSKNKKVLGE